MQKIDYVNAPDISSNDWRKVAESIQKHAFESAQLLMLLNNELIELRQEVERLKRGY